MIAELSKPRRVELILRQIDALPTLPAVAAHLLALTSSDDSNARQVIEAVRTDQALTAKILSLCRTADRGVRDEAITLDKAVVLLGFTAVRNAVLSVSVFEIFDDDVDSNDEDLPSSSKPHFPRDAFWIHNLAVAILAERIAAGHPGQRDLNRDEAFVCGLLHDVGKLALDHILPKAYARVVELTDLNQGNITEYERRVIGIDHHTAGKRLAEQWSLPHVIQDCIWLHGSGLETLPKLDHRRMIGLVTLADNLVRRQQLGYSGNHTFRQPIDEMVAQLGLQQHVVDSAVEHLREELERRAQALGMADETTSEQVIGSIQRANQALGRMNRVLESQGRAAEVQAKLLDAIGDFHHHAEPGRSVEDLLDRVVASACDTFGAGFYGMLMPCAAEETDGDDPAVHGLGDRRGGASVGWLVNQYSADGKPLRSQVIDAPPSAPDLATLDATQPIGVDLMAILPWIADYLVDADDLRNVKLLPLHSGWGTSAVLLHDRPKLPEWALLAPLCATWGGAIAAAGQHDGAKRLGEELAAANLALAEAQDQLLRTESMARLGEMAAGAAHEMNNPLAVISGRSQLLSMTLPAGTREQKAAAQVFTEAHRLSDLITALHMFAEPPQPDRRPADVLKLLDGAIKQTKIEHGGRENRLPIFLQVRQDLPPVPMDVDDIQRAICELLANAIQANPKSAVQVTAKLEPGGDAVMLQVVDDGDGMDGHTLDHALDPFFSNKPAGRRVGMGLPRADQLVKAHGGRLDLRSESAKGTTATIVLPLEAAASE